LVFKYPKSHKDKLFLNNINSKIRTNKESKKIKIKLSILIIIMLRVMIAQALLNIDLTLFDTLCNNTDFLLERSYSRHKLSKSNFNLEGMRHSLR